MNLPYKSKLAIYYLIEMNKFLADQSKVKQSVADPTLKNIYSAALPKGFEMGPSIKNLVSKFKDILYIKGKWNHIIDFSYRNFAEVVDVSYGLSGIGKGLFLQPAS